MNVALILFAASLALCIVALEFFQRADRTLKQARHEIKRAQTIQGEIFALYKEQLNALPPTKSIADMLNDAMRSGCGPACDYKHEDGSCSCNPKS